MLLSHGLVHSAQCDLPVNFVYYKSFVLLLSTIQTRQSSLVCLFVLILVNIFLLFINTQQIHTNYVPFYELAHSAGRRILRVGIRRVDIRRVDIRRFDRYPCINGCIYRFTFCNRFFEL